MNLNPLSLTPSMVRLLNSSFLAAAVSVLALVASSTLVAPSARAAGVVHFTTAHAVASASRGRGASSRPRTKPGAVVHRTRLHAAEDVANTAMLLGDDSIESQYDWLAGGQAEAFRLQAAATGVAHLVHVYISSGNGAGIVIVGLYATAKAHPGTLLSTGSARASSAGTWTTVSIAPTELVAGQTYWLAVLGEGGRLRYRDRAYGPCPSETSAQSTLDALPSAWKTGTVYSDCPISAYVTATAAAQPGSLIEPFAPAPPLESPAPVQEPTPVEAPVPPVQEPVVSTPSAPVNVAVPVVGGSVVEGQTLSASMGTWTGSQISYAYQWQDCNSSGGGCVSISGATASSYVLRASDVGHKMVVVVTASNAGGARETASTASGIVTAKEVVTPVDCFANLEGCGYPGPNDEGPNNEGAAHCSSLTPSGSKTITKVGEKIEGVSITGTLTIAAAKVTANDVCIDTDGEAREGSEAVRVEAAGKEFTISHSTIHGENESTKSVDDALNNVSSYEATGLVAEHDDIYNCGECIHYAWTIRKSYVLNDGMRGTSEHMEDMYTSNVPGYGPAPLVAEEDTMLNPYPQTAIIFGNTNDGGGGKCENSITAVKDFFAGGGWTAGYGCASATLSGGSTNFTDDRFARCLGTPEAGGSGGEKCGSGEVESTEPSQGKDEYGYWPHGGYFGVYADGQEVASKKWVGNFWDNNLHEVEENGEEGGLLSS